MYCQRFPILDATKEDPGKTQHFHFGWSVILSNALEHANQSLMEWSLQGT